MCTALSSQANLDNIKKEARNLLHALQRRDAAALRRYYSIDSLDDLSQPRLEDAQYMIARERGYSSWRKFTVHLHITNSPWNC
jgi:hypothetical protein